MAEQGISIRPAPPAPNAPKYYYPSNFFYVPEPYHTTVISKHHYEEPSTHHLPHALESARNVLGHAFHTFERELVHPYGEFPLPAPKADIRESKTTYYIDVDLPGAHEKSDIALKWTGLNTLFLEATVKRQPTPEDEAEPVAAATPPAAEAGAAAAAEAKKPKTVHLVKGERHAGRYARAFAFPVPVDQDKVTAKLAYGVLSVTVPKKVADKGVEHKSVEIEHSGH
ncbi:HSP20-like chaperone [Xylariales sp. PMI_506]|nr:HSP20-like chaperone [Xylariales sp. PMI_506]